MVFTSPVGILAIQCFVDICWPSKQNLLLKQSLKVQFGVFCATFQGHGNILLKSCQLNVLYIMYTFHIALTFIVSLKET